jgi:hypothetical protein
MDEVAVGLSRKKLRRTRRKRGADILGISMRRLGDAQDFGLISWLIVHNGDLRIRPRMAV